MSHLPDTTRGKALRKLAPEARGRRNKSPNEPRSIEHQDADDCRSEADAGTGREGGGGGGGGGGRTVSAYFMLD